MDDIRTVPLYTFRDVDRLAGAPRGTAQRWLRGYRDRDRIAPPVGRPSRGEPAASFIDLLEVALVWRLRRAGVPLQRIRRAAALLRELLGIERPLVSADLKVSGRDIFARLEGELVLVSGQSPQKAFADVIAPFLEDVDFDADGPARWWPTGRDAGIAVDPRYGFGYPVIWRTGVRADVLADLVEAGDPVDFVASQYGLEPAEVERAAQYMRKLAA